MINTFISILVEKKVLTVEEGEAIAKKIANATLPSDFKTAHAQVKRFLTELVDEL